MMVVVQPPSGEELNSFQVPAVVLREPFEAHRPVESLHIGILLRLARLDIVQPDLPLVCPALHQAAEDLWTVVAANGRGLASPLDDLLQGTDHAFRRQRAIDLDAQGFPIEVVDHIE